MGAGASTLELMGPEQLEHEVLYMCPNGFPGGYPDSAQILRNAQVTGAMIADMTIDELVSFLISLKVPAYEANDIAAHLLSKRNAEKSPEALRALPNDSIVFEIRRLGAAYASDADAIQRAKFNGQLLFECSSTNDLNQKLAGVGIEHAARRALIAARLMAIKQAYCGAHGSKVPTNQVMYIDHATITPRDAMTKVFKLQGIHLDPDDMEVAVDRIAQSIQTTGSDDAGSYDCFLSYRFESDHEMADRVYSLLVARGLRPFLDKVCLVHGHDWKQSFVQGLQHSRHVVALISRPALAGFRNAAASHARDPLLLEYEAALRLMDKTGNMGFFIPVFVGELTENGATLTKFRDFDVDVYANVVTPS